MSAVVALPDAILRAKAAADGPLRQPLFTPRNWKVWLNPGCWELTMIFNKLFSLDILKKRRETGELVIIISNYNSRIFLLYSQYKIINDVHVLGDYIFQTHLHSTLIFIFISVWSRLFLYLRAITALNSGLMPPLNSGR